MTSRPSARVWGAVALFQLAVTALVTRPALWHAHADLFGAPRGDKYLFLWVFWWVKHALLELHQLPFFTTLQYHATGVSLVLHDMTWFWSLLAIPLQALLEPPRVLNLVLLASLPLNGLAFFRLASEVTGSRWGALAGSVVFAYCPYQVARFQLSQVSLVGVFFVPLFALALWRYARDGRGAQLARAGVWWALQSLTSWYYGVALGLVLAAFLLARAARALVRGGPPLARLARHAAAAGALAAAIVTPFALPIAAQLGSDAYRDATTRTGHAYLEASSGDLLSYFVPSYTSAAWWGWQWSDGLRATQQRLREALIGNVVEKSVYPGWTAWAALATALALPALRRRSAPWIALALGFFVLSLGPTLQVGGARLLDGWLPARVFPHVPVLNVVRGPARFATFVALGAGVCLAFAIAHVEARRGRRAAAAAALGAVAFACLEFLPAPVHRFPMESWRSDFYEALRREPGDFTVLNVPVDFEGALGGGDLYAFAQTIHHKPIVGGYVSREPDAVRAPLRESAFLRAIHQRQYARDKRLRLGDAGLADLYETLRRLDVRYIVLHRTLLRASEWERVNGWLAPHLGPRVHEDRWIRAYSVR